MDDTTAHSRAIDACLNELAKTSSAISPKADIRTTSATTVSLVVTVAVARHLRSHLLNARTRNVTKQMISFTERLMPPHM